MNLFLRISIILTGLVLVSCVATSYSNTPIEKAKVKLSDRDPKVETLIKQLGDNDWSAREKATEELIGIGEPALAILREASKSNDLEIQTRAISIITAIICQNLINYPIVKSFPQLETEINNLYERLASTDSKTRMEALKTLEPFLCNKDTIAILIEFMTDTDIEIRRYICNLLLDLDCLSEEQIDEFKNRLLSSPEMGVRYFFWLHHDTKRFGYAHDGISKILYNKNDELINDFSHYLIDIVKDRHRSVQMAVAKWFERYGKIDELPTEIKSEYFISQLTHSEYGPPDKLKKIGKEAIPFLKKHLSDPEYKIKYGCAMILAELDCADDALPVLTEALKANSSDHLFRDIDYLIGGLGDERAVDALRDALKWERHYGDCGTGKICAAEALSMIGGDHAAEALIESLNYKAPGVERCAAIALGCLRNKKMATSLMSFILQRKELSGETLWKAIAALGQMGDTSVANTLSPFLKNADQIVRTQTAIALGELKSLDTLPPLLDAYYSNKNDYSRAAIVKAITEISGTKHLEIVINSLSDACDHVRYTSAEILCEIGDESCVPELIKCLKDKNGVVRNYAAQALGKIKDKKSVPALMESLIDKENRISSLVANALGQIKDVSIIPQLMKLLENKDLNDTERIIFLLARLGEPSAVNLLSNMLSEKEESLRQSAAFFLIELGYNNEKPYQIIRELLKSNNSWIRVFTAHSIVDLGDKSFIPDLKQMLTDTSIDDWLFSQCHAAVALYKLGDISGIRHLGELLTSSEAEDGNVSLNIITVLEKTNSYEAIPYLIKMLKAGSRGNAKEAAVALREITGQPYGTGQIEWQEWFKKNRAEQEKQDSAK